MPSPSHWGREILIKVGRCAKPPCQESYAREPLNRQFDRPDRSEIGLDWRVLGILNLYRVFVPLVLIGLYSLGRGGVYRSISRVFFTAALFYLCFGLFSVILVRKRLARRISTIVQATLDIVSLMLVLHSCGGIAAAWVCSSWFRWAASPFCCRRAALCSSPRSRPLQCSRTRSGSNSPGTPISPLTRAPDSWVWSCSPSRLPRAWSRPACAKAKISSARKIWISPTSRTFAIHRPTPARSLFVVDAGDKIRLINELAAEILGDTEPFPVRRSARCRPGCSIP